MYGGYQTIFIATNIEDCQITYLVGGRENGAKFIETVKLGVADNFIPPRKRALAVWVLFPKQAQSLPGDNMHNMDIVSQFEIFNKDGIDVTPREGWGISPTQVHSALLYKSETGE